MNPKTVARTQTAVWIFLGLVASLVIVYGVNLWLFSVELKDARIKCLKSYAVCSYDSHDAKDITLYAVQRDTGAGWLIEVAR